LRELRTLPQRPPSFDRAIIGEKNFLIQDAPLKFDRNRQRRLARIYRPTSFYYFVVRCPDRNRPELAFLFHKRFATAMYAGKVTLDCIRAGMALTATLSGSSTRNQS
jgi:hypothetical protein